MTPTSWQLACPTPLPSDERIVLAHGEGGRLMRHLIERHILGALCNPWLAALGDAAQLELSAGRLAMTTDSFVVWPLFFPGGDIGTLAVNGTVNDLAVAGARPLYLTLGLIAAEGLPLAVLDRVLASVAAAARAAGVIIVAGDTKVVPHEACDGLFINTAGIGALVDPVPPGPTALRPGDVLLVSGPIARHGIAVLCAREQLELTPPPESDCTALVEAVDALRRSGVAVRAMRDCTRGGLAAVLHEWARSSGCTLVLEESAVPTTPDVQAVCEILGLEPWHVACEGVFAAAVAKECQEQALAALHRCAISSQAACVGRVVAGQGTPVILRRSLGNEQPLDEPWGSPLPRIC